MKESLFDKIWESHVVARNQNGPDILWVDLHLIHEVTSPQAFDGLRINNRSVRHPELTLATADHNVPTKDIDKPVEDPISRKQLEVLDKNCKDFGIKYFPMGDLNQGIVHVIGPEQGLTLPGMVIVCGDSHTSTHGAFGALAFGIGTSEVEHVLATQTLPQMKPKSMAINLNGKLSKGVTSKDVILAVIGSIGTAGGAGHVIEYRGSLIKELSMPARMTICNMSIEAGAKAGMIAPDDITFQWLENRTYAPKGQLWEEALEIWRGLATDEGSVFDKSVDFEVSGLEPYVSWGTNPSQVAPVTAKIPDPDSFEEPSNREAASRALAYMGLKSGTPINEVKIDTVFIGSCTNSRIEDLEVAAAILEGKKIKEGLRAMAVPGSGRVKKEAEKLGLDKIFISAGFEWREPGCSMCLAMNPDKLSVGERCVSTSNRNFEGRQGRGGRTHLASPLVAAASALSGYISDPREVM
jgi:3-isopropylmalate/(R)-2-methylmalate dehydratase large subunit